MFKTLVSIVLLCAPAAVMAEDAVKRLDAAAGVLSEVMSAPDRGIPLDLLSRASCIVIVPGMKGAAFVVGAKYGKGFISCRKGAEWSAPGAIRVEGGSFGFQIGGQDTDVVMLVMNGRGAQHLLSGQFTLGGEGSVAAGPVGRASTAQTDASMHAEILSWSRNHGIFAGIAVQGATLRQDLGDNAEMYGQPFRNKQIVDGNVQWPKSGTELESILRKYALQAGEQRRKS